MKKKNNRRISFNDWDAFLLYEWWLALNDGLEKTRNTPIQCMCCPPIAKRLEKFLGKKEVKKIKKAIKENPYFKSPSSLLKNKQDNKQNN